MRKSMQVPGAVPGTERAWQTSSIIKMFSSAHLCQLLLHNPSPQSSMMDTVTVNMLSMLKLRLAIVIADMTPEWTAQLWTGSSAQHGLGCNAVPVLQFLILQQTSPSLFTQGLGNIPKASKQRLRIGTFWLLPGLLAKAHHQVSPDPETRGTDWTSC